MQLIADLHIHGRYSQATSKQLDIPNLEKYARIKGVDLLGTGDFTHPKWIEELNTNLTEDDTGFLKTKSGFPFVLQTEISLIYSQSGKGRRVHNVVLAPDLDTVRQITDYLLTKGRVDYDGRPIFKIPCPDFVESLKSISQDIEVIPAHIWTPWFSMFGSKSGFDTVEECFKDQAKHIHAIETGLSSDPPMNWRLSQLDNYQILSFSDLHSFWPWRIGREAAILDIQPTYKSLLKAIRSGEGLKGTIEVDPNYGKYHFDGHRNCNIVLSPTGSAKHKGICPVCRGPLTIGVLNRVEQLADREEGFKPNDPKPFHTLVPLSELISAELGTAVATQKVWKVFNDITHGNSEFYAVLNMPEEDLLKRTSPELTKLILLNRVGKLKVRPGYDGVYGELVLDSQEDKEHDVVPKKSGVVPKSSRPAQTGLDQFM